MTAHNTDRDEVAEALAAEADRGFADDQIGDAQTAPGRPALPEGDARSEQVVVRVTPADKARLVWLAEFLGEAQSDVARRALDSLFRQHGIKDAADPDSHLMVSTGHHPGESMHFFRELVGSEAFAEAVANQVRRELDRREQHA